MLRAAARGPLLEEEAEREALRETVLDAERRLDVRFEVLEALAATSRETDRELFEEAASLRKKDPLPPEMRAAAFRAAAPWLSSEALVRSTKGDLALVRMVAFEILAERGDKRLGVLAKRTFEDVQRSTTERLQAGRLWLAADGARAGRQIFEAVDGVTVAESLAFGMADALADARLPTIERTVRKRIRGARGDFLRYLLRVGRHVEGGAVSEAFLRALDSDDPRLKREALRGVAERRQASAVESLRQIVRSDDSGFFAALAVEAQVAMRDDDRFEAELCALAEDLRPPVRVAGLRALGALGPRAGTAVEDALVKALEVEADWTTRLAAAEALEDLRSRRGVGALCQRVAHEEGRPLKEMVEILWRLTGQSFGTSAEAWGRWWQDHGDDFVVLRPEELERLTAERDERLLRRTTRGRFQGREGEQRSLSDLQSGRVTFFGAPIESRRVAFAVDVSASMDERLGAPIFGQETRLELARHELIRILDSLEEQMLFRIITFSGLVDQWDDTPRDASEENKRSAMEFVSSLRGAPATNFYDMLRLAFADESIDTLFLLSDGEPNYGDVTDPTELRAIVAEWNRHRGVRIHCVAIGSDLGLLRTLAKDSGGTYAYFP